MENDDKAKNTIILADNAISYINKATSIIGSRQNTLEMNSNIVINTNENTVEARSKITDVDMGLEILNITKNKLLLEMSQKLLSSQITLAESTMRLLSE